MLVSILPLAAFAGPTVDITTSVDGQSEVVITEDEAKACLKYIKTRFLRTMLGVLKITQENNKDTWKYVPLQDFTSKSDIDWSKSIHEIDLQLYKKYGLNKEEQDWGNNDET